jgi:hypothetical protein
VKKVNKNSPASRSNSPALLCIFSGQTAPSPRHYTHNAPITKIGFGEWPSGFTGGFTGGLEALELRIVRMPCKCLTPDGQHVVRVASSDWLQCPFIVRGESRLSTFNEAGRTVATGSSYIRTDSSHLGGRKTGQDLNPNSDMVWTCAQRRDEQSWCMLSMFSHVTYATWDSWLWNVKM